MELVMLICLASSPQSCREERLLVSYEMTDPRACMMGAVPAIAEWAGDHPEYEISRWKCGASGAKRLTRSFE